MAGAVCRRLPWRPRCLVQAITVAHCLSRRRLPFEITIGVRRDRPETLGAHAWLRVGETIVIGGTNNAHFVEMMSIRPDATS